MTHLLLTASLYQYVTFQKEWKTNFVISTEALKKYDENSSGLFIFGNFFSSYRVSNWRKVNATLSFVGNEWQAFKK